MLLVDSQFVTTCAPAAQWCPAPVSRGCYTLACELLEEVLLAKNLLMMTTPINIPSFYGSFCANNGKDALNTPVTISNSN
eukprot:4677426-Pyramimonas_sp.AAC.1